MPQIFLLEDDAALGRGIALALSGPERAVTQADSVARAREALAGARLFARAAGQVLLGLKE